MSLFRAITRFVASHTHIFIADCFASECWREGAQWQGQSCQQKNTVLSINTSLIFSSVLFKRRVQWLEKGKWLMTSQPSLCSAWVITHPLRSYWLLRGAVSSLSPLPCSPCLTVRQARSPAAKQPCAKHSAHYNQEGKKCLCCSPPMPYIFRGSKDFSGANLLCQAAELQVNTSNELYSFQWEVGIISSMNRVA